MTDKAMAVRGEEPSLMQMMARLAEGEDVEVPYNGRGDEIGDMAKALAVFKENTQRIARLREEHTQAELREAGQRRTMLLGMADELEANIRHVVESVSTAAALMQTTAHSMSTIAADTSSKAATVAAARGGEMPNRVRMEILDAMLCNLIPAQGKTLLSDINPQWRPLIGLSITTRVKELEEIASANAGGTSHTGTTTPAGSDITAQSP